MKHLALVLWLSGCAVGEKYYVTHADLARVPTLAHDEPVVARRVRYYVPTHVRAGALRLDRVSRVDDYQAIVPASAPSPMVTAGQVLTWIGSAASIAGTILFLVTPSDSAPWAAGIATAVSAEPLMISGTVLWLLGLKKRPAETTTGAARP